MKALKSRFYLLLTSLILLLGFGGCKSNKKAVKEEKEKTTSKENVEEYEGIDSELRQGDPRAIRVLYGGPPPIKK